MTVSCSTADDTATAGVDYQTASGTATIPAGQTSVLIPVMVNGDLRVETDEYFSLELSDAPSGYIDNGCAYGFIRDDDTPPAISISGDGLYEGNSGKQLPAFTGTLSFAPGEMKRRKIP